jgi:hypothetical protein
MLADWLHGSAKTGTDWNIDQRYVGTCFTSRRVQSRRSPQRPAQLPVAIVNDGPEMI